jgi:hypothetical protein
VVDCQVFQQHAKTQGGPCIPQDMACCSHLRTRIPGAITPVLRNALVSQAAVMSRRCLGTGGATVCRMTSLRGQAVRPLGIMEA